MAARLDSLLARALRPFAKVEPTEAANTVVLTVTVFILLTAYYFLKTAREPLILLGGGAEVKSYAAAGQAALLLVFVRAYQSVAQRVGRLKLLAIVYLFFATNLAVFAVLAGTRVPIGVPFYLWVGVFNYTSIAQFWAFAADVFTPEQGKRIFAIVGVGGSLGALAGARLAHELAAGGPQVLMFAAMVLLVVCVLLIAWVDRRSQGRALEASTESKEEPLTQQSALELLTHDPFLILLAALTLLLSCVNSTGEYLLDRTLLETLARDHAPGDPAAFITRFKADYFGWVNFIGVLVQLFAVSRFLTRFGVRAALYCLPVVALGGYGLLLFAPVLALIRLAKIAENSVDYSIQNTARQALYLVATRAEKFVGKTAVDTFFVRFGDVISAGLVWTGSRLAISTPGFAGINLALIGLWLVVLVFLGREHKKRSLDAPTGIGLKQAVPAAIIPLAVVFGVTRADAAEKRQLPDYDGRGGEPTTAGEDALWVPRVLFSPVYFVTEFVLRRPLGAAVAGAERSNLPEWLYNFFFFGPDHKAGFAPIAFFDFGFAPSVGVYTFWDDAFANGNDLRLHATTWGVDWLAGVLTDRVHLGGDDTLEVRLAGIRRPDYVFFGIGPDTRQTSISRFGEDRLDARAATMVRLGGGSSFESDAGVRSVSFYDGHWGEDPSLEKAAAIGEYPLPFPYGRGYTAVTTHLRAALDSRRPRPEPGSGVRLEVEGEPGADLRASPGSTWIRYGASLGGFVDLNGKNRVLGVSLATLFADPVGSGAIPFTELVSLGGAGPMPGFVEGRLLDRSAAAATVHYRWPIWVWLDGSAEVATGNVFGDHLEEFKAGRLRLSGAIGVESVGSRDGSFGILFGLGTETFDQGAKVDSVRLAVGTNRGF